MALRSERRFISMADIKSGMMIDFTYTKQDNTTGKYSVLVIDPFRTTKGASEPQVHAYEIGDLTDYGIIRLLIDIKVPIIIDPSERGASLGELASDEVYNAFKDSQFYTRDRYKRFSRSKMKMVRQILLGELEDIPITGEKIEIYRESSKRQLLDALDRGEKIDDIPEIKESLKKIPPVEEFVQMPGESLYAFEKRKRAGKQQSVIDSTRTEINDTLGLIKRSFDI